MQFPVKSIWEWVGGESIFATSTSLVSVCCSGLSRDPISAVWPDADPKKTFFPVGAPWPFSSCGCSPGLLPTHHAQPQIQTCSYDQKGKPILTTVVVKSNFPFVLDAYNALADKGNTSKHSSAKLLCLLPEAILFFL